MDQKSYQNRTLEKKSKKGLLETQVLVLKLENPSIGCCFSPKFFLIIIGLATAVSFATHLIDSFKVSG